ncbi:uncharacterized protein LOC100897854 [Galendromus occidentalis]|uniref:Uncharacterized protein LOC100897854 n=1 Tax=Galendromus occidentalis TaxID=34638 RepID=A0AAJ7SGK4_9ACAR|nr:uncharacterized protein LOC100897854 [Galendromus occidentalis]
MAGIMQAESSGVHAASQQPGGHPLPGPRISHGDHRLVAAARDGDVKKLRKLLQKHGVNVNARDTQTGNTALMVASLVQDPDAIAALLEAGADPTLHNYTGQNCLDSLTPSLVQYVLRSPDIVDCAGVKSDEKRLLLAAWSGNKEQVLRLLTTTSVDVNCTNAEGSTPLTLLCRDLGTFTELYANQVIDSYDPLSVIQILLEHGVLIHRDVNHQDRQGRSCLHYAAHTRCEHTAPVIAMLLHHGAKVDMKDKHGFCPVHFASQSGSVEALRLLLDHGADPSAPGLGGITPLHLAASAGNTEAVLLLLQRDADSLTFASDGKSPLCCAANQDVYNVLRRAVEARLASPENSSLRSEKKKLAELILQQSGPSMLQQSEEEDDSSETESPPNLSEAEGAARDQRYDGHEVAPDDLRRRLVEDDIQLMNQVQKILDESEWEEKSSAATLDPSAAYHHQTTMPSNSVLDPSPEVAHLTIHDNPLLDPDECTDGPCYSVASKKSNGADVQPELPPRFSSVSRPRAKKPSPHLSRMKLDRETAESLTHGRHSQIDTNSHYYYKFPTSSMGTANEGDNDSLYTKPEERAAIVRPSRPPVQQPMKLSILKPTAAASAAKGALLSKFLPPWANRASHLSSASWVYLPQVSPGESGDVAYSDDDDGASPSPQPPMAMNSATIGSNGSGDNIVVPQLPARSSLSLTRRDARKPPKNPVCPVPGLQKDPAHCSGAVFINPTRDSTSNLASQIPPNVKVIDAPQTMSNARRAKGSTALNSRPLGGSLRPTAKPQGIHSDPKMAPPTPKSFPEIPAFSSDPPFPWVKGKLIGKGAFGLVWCGMNCTGQLVAVKQFQIQEQQHTDEVLSAVQLEVDILQSLKHMNIVGFLGVQQDGANINLFLEFVSGGTLASNLAQFGAFPESVVQRYARQLFQAVAYLHSRSVIHRDIKGNNVMVCPGTGTIKIIDFGCATFDPSGTDHDRLAASARGTPYWMAPEVICQQECSHKSDMWSIGCTLIEMFQTKPPWYELSPLAAAFAIGQGTSDPKLPEHLSQHARDITMKCLNRTPSERPTAEEILGHPFLQTGDIESNAS